MKEEYKSVGRTKKDVKLKLQKRSPSSCFKVIKADWLPIQISLKMIDRVVWRPEILNSNKNTNMNQQFTKESEECCGTIWVE